MNYTNYSDMFWLGSPEMLQEGLIMTSSRLELYGNAIIHGWIISWNTYVIGAILLMLIIWNIVMSVKLKKCVKEVEDE